VNFGVSQDIAGSSIAQEYTAFSISMASQSVLEVNPIEFAG
jgi:hypothetical protein